MNRCQGHVCMRGMKAILSGSITGHDEKVSEHTVHCCLLHMGSQTGQSSPRKSIKWARERQKNWTMEQ